MTNQIPKPIGIEQMKNIRSKLEIYSDVFRKYNFDFEVINIVVYVAVC